MRQVSERGDFVATSAAGAGESRWNHSDVWHLRASGAGRLAKVVGMAGAPVLESLDIRCSKRACARACGCTYTKVTEEAARLALSMP